jgi:nucleoside-diphosphate-sugar epimerase
METENTQVKTTLVLGGTGKTGRRVVERLQARGMPVRVGSRSGEPPSTGTTKPPGRPRSKEWSLCTSPTTRT